MRFFSDAIKRCSWRPEQLDRMLGEHGTESQASHILPATVVIGGDFDVKACSMAPTVMDPSDWVDPAMRQEVLGPVLPVRHDRDLPNTLAIHEHKPKSLAACVFSTKSQSVDRVLGSFSFGGGCVSQTDRHCWIDSLPFVGVGASGTGEYHGKAGFDPLSNTNAMLIGKPDLELDVFPLFVGKDIAKYLNVIS